MKRLLVFASASASTAVVWASFWPREVPISPPSTPPVVELRWTRERIAGQIAAVENAKTDEQRLAACGELLRIPIAEFPDLLERADRRADRGLSLATKTLLIRWASLDGEAAVNWAWQRFRADGVWENAFQEIGPAWAAHDPAGFAKWVMRTGKNMNSAADTITLAEGVSADAPLLESGTFSEIPLWLVTEDPRLAYQVLQIRNSSSSEDYKLRLKLDSAAKVRQALEAFDLGKLDLRINGGKALQAKLLMERWQELDPEDFSRSSYAALISRKPVEKSSPQSAPDPAPNGVSATLKPAGEIPPEEWHAAFVSAFDEWTAAHPGERPDMSGWSETRRRAWSDLEALPASPVRNSGG